MTTNGKGKLDAYRKGEAATGANLLWPLYGAGMENLGVNGKPIEAPLPKLGDDELLVRHDACGLCFSDIKVISAGQKHPRIFKDMQTDPVVLGHEVAMTVVGVGKNLRGQYKAGDRFIIQADIYVKGVNYAYGYMLQGGLSRYGVIDQRILNGDDGNYLLPVKPSTGYAESALTEPWACVIAAYRLQYRSKIKAGGIMWVIGAAGAGDDYTVSAGFDADSHPSRLLLTNAPPRFAAWLKRQAKQLGIAVEDVADLATPPANQVDDIIMLGGDPATIETVSPFLADFGVFALINNAPLSRPVSVDIGRVHYNRWLYAGGTGKDIALAYSKRPITAELKPKGRAWFVGAGGPMGRMHVQRAVQHANGPSVIVCTDVSDLRLRELCTDFGDEAREKGIEFICLNPKDKEAYTQGMAQFKDKGFDNIIGLAPVPPVISDSANYLAPGGLMNIFAGVSRGTLAQLDLSNVYLKDMRVIGHSASTIEELQLMLRQAESGELSPNRSVAAIGSLSAARDGLQSVMDTTFPGKVVIYPHLKDLPLTALPDLKDKLPTVFAKLKNGREWTVEAEDELLRAMLED
jgi:D-arabinose 1-dehydrogenase-like Zn-dependent alcohol dehydrogenase